jgi:hypothetical protein
MSLSKTFFKWTKKSPVLTTLVSYITLNLLTILLTGTFSALGLLTNLFPALMAFFLSSMYNEGRKDKVYKKQI